MSGLYLQEVTFAPYRNIVVLDGKVIHSQVKPLAPDEYLPKRSSDQIKDDIFVILLVLPLTATILSFIVGSIQVPKIMYMPEYTPPATSSPIKEKWGDALNEGFVVIPATLLRYQHQLNLDSREMVVLMNLLMSWWKVDEFPFPRTSTLAKRIGVTTRTIQRNVESLEQKKLIKRIWRKSDKSDARAAASYDLSGIVAELKRLGSVG